MKDDPLKITIEANTTEEAEKIHKWFVDVANTVQHQFMNDRDGMLSTIIKSCEGFATKHGNKLSTASKHIREICALLEKDDVFGTTACEKMFDNMTLEGNVVTLERYNDYNDLVACHVCMSWFEWKDNVYNGFDRFACEMSGRFNARVTYEKDIVIKGDVILHRIVVADKGKFVNATISR